MIYTYISSTGEKHHNKIEPGAGSFFFATRRRLVRKENLAKLEVSPLPISHRIFRLETSIYNGFSMAMLVIAKRVTILTHLIEICGIYISKTWRSTAAEVRVFLGEINVHEVSESGSGSTNAHRLAVTV